MNRTSPLEASLPSLAAIRQTLPVVERDSPDDTANARVTRSDIWGNHFESFHLEENVLALERDYRLLQLNPIEDVASRFTFKKRNLSYASAKSRYH